MLEAHDAELSLKFAMRPLDEMSKFSFKPNFLPLSIIKLRDNSISEKDFLVSELQHIRQRGEYLGYFNHFSLNKLRSQLGGADTELPLVLVDGPDAYKIAQFNRYPCS